MEFHFQGSSERPEEMGDELGSAIRSDMSRNTVFGEYVDDKEFSKTFGRDGVMARDE